MQHNTAELLKTLSEQYNDPKYFEEDPIRFPKLFAEKYKNGEATLQDVEIAGLLAAHLAWGRRSLIVRDCCRMFDEMDWKPYQYILSGKYKCDGTSLHRTIKWCDFAQICTNLKRAYSQVNTIEHLSPDEIRVLVYGQKSDPKATNKKIHMFRRWMVRDDGIVDIGLWKSISKDELIIPLDVHVFNSAKKLSITERKSPNLKAALEITEYLKEVFPNDPTLGDYALFAYSVVNKEAFDDNQ